MITTEVYWGLYWGSFFGETTLHIFCGSIFDYPKSTACAGDCTFAVSYVIFFWEYLPKEPSRYSTIME